MSIGSGAILALAMLTPTADAVRTDVENATAACNIQLGSVTAAGAHTASKVVATTPPSVQGLLATPGVYGPGQVRFSSTFNNLPNGSEWQRFDGYVAVGNALYSTYYVAKANGQIETTQPSGLLVRIGGGWSPFTMVEAAIYPRYTGSGWAFRWTNYALRNDGVLFRWTGAWRLTGSYPGFAAVKSMALISQTATYDTFLANTRGGGLYTIRIPVAATAKPVVRVVRTATWQVFESLVAAKCGLYGTLLLAIDKDANAGYVYAVGHTNGTSTVIKGIGKVQTGLADPVYFRWRSDELHDVLNGD